MMVFRSKARAFVDDWLKVIEADDKIWDQNAFNDLVRKNQSFLPDDPNHYFKGEAHTHTLHIRPPRQGRHAALITLLLCVRTPVGLSGSIAGSIADVEN
jgi:hypothetical protein